jgi:hypothetical protein
MIYLYDRMRHLVCVPYSVDGLHAMADHLGIPRHWYHGGKRPHYDIPKRDISRIQDQAIEVPPRVILKVIQGVEDLDLNSYIQLEPPNLE